MVKTSGKKAFEPGWQKHPLSLADYSDWRQVQGNGVGVLNGGQGNVYVVDIDDIDAAMPTLLAWELNEPTPTLLVETSPDHFHYFFTYSGPEKLMRKTRPYPGIDLLGINGYTALHEPLDRYHPEHMAEMPEKLVQAWLAAQEPAPLTEQATQQMMPGNRNQTVASLTGQLLKGGVPIQAAHDQLQGINAASAHPLPASEVAHTVASIARYHPPAEPLASAWPILNLNQIAQLDLPAKEIIIGPFMSASVTILAAMRGTGKTAWATMIGQAVASGEAFCGMEVNRPGPVCFVQLDMGIHSVKGRAMDATWHPDFHYVTRWQFQRQGLAVPNLGEPEHHASIIAMLRNYRMVIFDTRRACQPPGAGQDGNLWHPSYWLKSAPVRYALTDAGVSVVLLDHLTADGQVKDTKAIEDDADCVIALKDSDKGTKETCFQMELTKDRDHVNSELIYFEFDDLQHWRKFTDTSRMREVWEWRKTHSIAECADEFDIGTATVKRWCRSVREEIKKTHGGK